MDTSINNAAFIVAGWSIVTVVIVGYATSVILRGRALTKRVPAAQRRWSTDNAAGSTRAERAAATRKALGFGGGDAR